jgi:hypothetical protein
MYIFIYTHIYIYIYIYIYKVIESWNWNHETVTNSLERQKIEDLGGMGAAINRLLSEV